MFRGWHIQAKMKTELQAQEIRTEPLNISQLATSVTDITALLQSRDLDSVEVTYGWACKLPEDQLWRPKEIKTQQLQFFIERSVDTGVYQFGRCDLHIEDKQKTFEFRLCHESDVHFESIDQTLVAKVESLWLQKGLTLYISTGPKGSALPKEWKRIDPTGT